MTYNSSPSSSGLWMPQVSADGARWVAHNAEGTYIFDRATDKLQRKEQSLHVAELEATEGIFRGDQWSPDGTRILGTVNAGLSTTTVAVYDLERESFTVYREPSGADSIAGNWLPDGRRFLATAAGSAWVVDSQAQSWKELPLQVGTGTVRLTRDGRTLHYIHSTTEADIWLVRMR